jgi:hypothetical protein
MDCSTGYLYQYRGGMIVDEDERKNRGILKDINNMRQLLIRYPSLRKAFIDSGFDEYLKKADRV